MNAIYRSLHLNKIRRQIKTPAFLIAYSTLMVAAVLIISGCGRDVGAGTAEAAVEPVNVHVKDVSQEKRVLPVHSSGRLASKAEIKLSFKIGGVVDQLLVDEGRQVGKGTRLARLNLAEIDAQVLQAKSGLDKAIRDRDRAEGLYQDSVATLEQVQDARTGVEIAEANLKIATFNRRYAEIYAPSSGRILKRTVEAGELIGAGQPVYLFGADREGWVVRVGLSDRDIVKLAAGDSAALSFDPYPNQVFKGWVTEIADAADPMSSTFEVEISIDDPGHLLKSGFIARVDIFPAKAKSLYFLPIEALVEGNGEEGFVYVYDEADKEAKKVAVQIERILGEEIAVSGGLEENQQVITEGAGFLDGDGPVSVMARAE